MHKKLFYGWYIVFSGFLLMLTVYVLCISCSSIFIKPVSEALNFSRGEFSFSTTVLMISYMIFSIIVGKLSTGKNIKRIIIFSILLTSLGFFGYFISTNIFMFYLFSFIAGIGVSGSTIIPISILITSWFHEKRGLALAIALTGSGVGGAIFSPFINYILQNFGYKYTYLTLAIILALLTIPIFIIVKPTPESINLKPYGYSNSLSDEPNCKKGISLRDALKNYRLYIYIISLIIIGIIGNGVLIHFSAAFTDIGYSSSIASNILSISLLLLVVGKIIQGQIFDRFSMKSSLVYGWFFFSYTAFGLLFIDNPIMLVIYIVAFGLGEGFVVVAPPLMTSSFFGERDYSSIYGISNMAVALGGAIGTSLSGIIYDYFGSYTFAWKLYSVLSLVMLIIFLILSSSKKYQL